MHDVSGLCIGKPPLRWLPPSATVADAVAELSARPGPDAAVAVWDGKEGSPVAGRVCMADVLLFLCADAANLASPAAALQATLSDLVAAGGAPPVRRIEPQASVVEAVDALLLGARALVVPLRERWRGGRGGGLCWLTVEDVVRFFLSSVALFAPTASRSVSDLGVVRPPALAVAAGDAALSAVPLLRAALESHASVAVVDSGGACHHLNRVLLAGEISPSALCACDVSAAAAVAALSAGDLVGFVEWGGAPPDATLHAVRSRLRRRNLLGMLDLLYGGVDDPPSSSSSASSSCSSSSSSDDEDECRNNGRLTGTTASRVTGAGWSTRRRRRRAAEEAIVCHRGSSLVAVMVQAMAHRATQVWVVEEGELVGVVRMLDVLRVLRHHLLQLHHVNQVC